MKRKNPGELADRTLLSSVFINGDMEAYEKAGELLPLLSIPDVPYEGYVNEDSNVTRLYMPQGVIISLAFNRPWPWQKIAPVFKAAAFVDDSVLQPAAVIPLSEICRLEIIPGVAQASATESDLRAMAKNLEKKGIKFYKPELEFIGTVRAPDGEDQKLILNRRAILAKGEEIVSGDATMQQKIFGFLGEAFTDAIQSGSAAAVQRVYKECASIASLAPEDPEKILHRRWEDPGTTERSRKNYEAAKVLARALAAA